MSLNYSVTEFLSSVLIVGEGNGTPLHYSCLENPMEEEPGRLQSIFARSQTRLSDFPFTFHFHALEKEMATHSSVLAWRIPGMGEPGRLPSMGSHRVGHDWSDLAAAAVLIILLFATFPIMISKRMVIIRGCINGFIEFGSWKCQMDYILTSRNLVVYMLFTCWIVEGRLQQPNKGCVIKESDPSGSCNRRFLFTKKIVLKIKEVRIKLTINWQALSEGFWNAIEEHNDDLKKCFG